MCVCSAMYWTDKHCLPSHADQPLARPARAEIHQFKARTAPKLHEGGIAEVSVLHEICTRDISKCLGGPVNRGLQALVAIIHHGGDGEAAGESGRILRRYS